MCEITELKQEKVTFSCKVTRQDLIEITFDINPTTLKNLNKIQANLNIEGKENLPELAKYIAEQFQDDVTEFDGIGAIKIDDVESKKDVKGIGIKVIQSCDRKTRVMRC
ncbi:MAG: hypothetical protein K0S61_716 [Anaerocolumna sp.]|jgi:hypothetical protein|nr:hypothetical protein [Anaerocolumna sp.]